MSEMSVEHVDELVDDRVHGQREMSVEPRRADLFCSPDESVRFEAQLQRRRYVVIGAAKATS
jgi:hypothetical protein